MPDINVILLAIILLILFAGSILLSLKKFEVAVLGVVVSPWVAACFYMNGPDSDYTQDAGIGSYLRIGLILMLGIAGAVKYIQLWPVHKGKISIHLLLLGVFILFAFMSAGYSIDKNFTLIRAASFLLLGGFLLGLEGWLQEKAQVDRVIDMFFVFIVISVLVNIIVLIVYPSRAWWWSEPNRFIGMWDHPNSIGGFCTVSYPVIFWKLSRAETLAKKAFIISILLSIIAFQYFAGSRTSIFATGLGIFLWFLVQKKTILAILVIMFLAAAFGIIEQFRPKELMHGDESGGLFDLRGRDDFWKGAFILISENPFLGYGYGVDGKVWQDARFYNVDQTLWKGSAKTSLHNGYLSVAIGVGLVLFLLWCVIIILPLFYLFKLPGSRYKAFLISILAIILLTNFFESAIQNGNSIDSVFYWISWILAGKMQHMDFSEYKNILVHSEESMAY